jgi:succinate dehydrogenase / fumarate reductase iron-sulfur subunit
MTHAMDITAEIKRFNPDTDDEPHWESYEVEAEPLDSALSVLLDIKWHIDGTLSFRKSCAHGICGSDAMQINGENKLACQQLIGDLVDEDGDVIRFAPMPSAPVVKDLVIDQSQFFEKYREIKPWLINDEPAPEREREQSPEELEMIEDATKCIMCGACTHSCPSTWANPDYLGPAAFVKAYRYTFDSRDRGADERLDVIDSKDGVWMCYDVFNCVESCPKDIDITRWIAALKRKAATRT